MDDENNHLGLLEQFHNAEDALISHCKSLKITKAATAVQMEALQEQFAIKGLTLRKGRWTLQEKQLLNKNFENFSIENEEEIGDPVDFTQVSTNKSRASEVKRLKKDLGFLRAMSKGLFREYINIGIAMKHTLDPLAVSNGQKYTVEDLHLLKTLVDKLGRNWSEISKQMGRSAVSLQSAHRNFFLHEQYTRQPPTSKQQRKLLKEMQKRFPDTDLTTELVHDVAWNDIANKIGFMHGKYLHQFWECNIKYRDEEGKLRFKKPGKLPVKILRKFIKFAARQSPTHLDALNWDECFKMFTGYAPGVVMMKAIIPKLAKVYKINYPAISLSEALLEIRKVLKQQKKLGFQSIWQEIKSEAVETIRWQQFHWALAPNLAHYVQNRPVMYWGYAEDHSEGIKREIEDPDMVW